MLTWWWWWLWWQLHESTKLWLWGRHTGLGRTAGFTMTFLNKHGPGTGAKAAAAAADVAADWIGLGSSCGLTTIGTQTPPGPEPPEPKIPEPVPVPSQISSSQSRPQPLWCPQWWLGAHLWPHGIEHPNLKLNA